MTRRPDKGVHAVEVLVRRAAEDRTWALVAFINNVAGALDLVDGAVVDTVNAAHQTALALRERR